MLNILLLIILVILIMCNIFLLKNIFLKISKIKLIFSFLYIIFFIYIFRYLNFFREKNPINIKLLFLKLFEMNYISIIILIVFFLRRFKFNLIKIYFLNLHYFFLFKSKNFYFKVFYFINRGSNNLRKKLAFFSLKIPIDFLYFFFKYYFIAVFLTVFILEILFNNFILYYTLEIIPYFGFYSFSYRFLHYLIYVNDLEFDIKLSNFFYLKKRIKGKKRFE